MDFSKLSVPKTSTFKFEVLHPETGDGVGSFIEVYSSESDQVKRYQASLLRKVQKQEFENLRSRKPKIKELSEYEDETIDSAVVRIAGWENVEFDGKELEFTEENARKLLSSCKWLASQIIEQSEKIGNFLKA
ncbi:hypothetical protein [Gallibacterium genomosp. 3]|uniref:Uncharacterized protein n=1 Tax=Gallibacterium genomosp. 3 TaxID=505345 RepID=A0A1A7PWT3_9PAST|nr:hypothetical protein [Gallibacterium genomosp. 3]OBX06182.1 hypothetical protein QV07_08860 [Gallibacterium genomosp. 3]